MFVFNLGLRRIESISKSPIVSFFSESLVGLTSIRAYREQKRFSHVREIFIPNDNFLY